LNCENGSVYAENKTEKILIQDVKEINTTQNVLSYSQKINSITNKGKSELEYADVCDALKDTENIGTEALNKAESVNKTSIQKEAGGIGAKSDTPFLIDDPTEKLLNVNYCLVLQQDPDGIERGLCWAASVATIVRYMQGNPYLMAYNVADMMGIDYDIGANIYQMSDALFRYGLNFNVFNSQLNWNQVVSNINNKRPASMVLFTTINGERSGHAVTLIGYSSDSMALVYWNSGNHCIQISTHSFTTYIPYGGYSWLWENSLY
jgi:hypothetical protein